MKRCESVYEENKEMSYPKDFPSWYAIYMTFWRLRNTGIWGATNHHLRRQVRIKAGCHPDPSVAIIDFHHAQKITSFVNNF